MVQQVGHFRGGPVMALLLFQGLTQLPSFLPYLAAQQLLVVGQLGSPGGLATCFIHGSVYTSSAENSHV